jgi:hypothetical protein
MSFSPNLTSLRQVANLTLQGSINGNEDGRRGYDAHDYEACGCDDHGYDDHEYDLPQPEP